MSVTSYSQKFVFQHQRIHAWGGEAVLQYFDNTIVEGNVYDIQNFVVKYYETEEIGRSFQEERYIILSNLTKIVLLNESTSTIPFNVWNFTDLGAVYQLDKSINHFIGNSETYNFFPKF